MHGAHAVRRYPGDPSGPVAFIDHVSPRACGLLRNSAWPAKGRQPVSVMERAVTDYLARPSEPESPVQLQGLLDCIETALQPLAGHSKDFPEEDLWDLGGSIALILPFDQQINVVRVGDFRVVRLRAGQLDVLAREHTLRAQLEHQGQAIPSDAGGNIIVAYLGGHVRSPSDAITTGDVQVGDRIAIFEHPGTRPLEEDLAILTSVHHLPPAQSAQTILDALVERAAAPDQRLARAVAIIDVVA